LYSTEIYLQCPLLRPLPTADTPAEILGRTDLQQVVVCQEYSQRRFDDGEDQEQGLESIKSIILDERFRSSLVHVLMVAHPIVKLLFTCDNQAKELMGKVYYHMFQTGESISRLQGKISWSHHAKRFHAARWEYLHSEMHSAGYSLDPEFLYRDGGQLDEATMSGLIAVIERLSVRHVIQNALDPLSAADSLTVQSPQVQEHAHTCMHGAVCTV
jgi:hypothetical protein